MNHGIVMFSGNGELESRLWAMATGRSQFVALYTEKRMEQGADGFASDLWSKVFVRTIAEPLSPLQLPDRAGDHAEYARYEPAYDQQFLDMCRRCTGYSGAPTVVLPATAGDKEAMRLLVELQSTESGAWTYLHERFYIVPRQNLRRQEKSPIRMSHRMESIRLNGQWAYFLGFFRGGDGVVVFLSDRESDVEGLFQTTAENHPAKRQADWLYDLGVIEKW
jgi:hypothetical protein